MNYKTIYIAGINRSGGSLLSRLFDNHPDNRGKLLEIGSGEGSFLKEVGKLGIYAQGIEPNEQ